MCEFKISEWETIPDWPHRGGLDDYFPFIFPNGHGAVLILAGYFDESERDDATLAPICVGGYLFKEAGYKKFQYKWNRDVLSYKNRRFTHFHITDLYSGHGEYEGMSIPERLDILNLAINAITKHSYMGVGIYFDRIEFEKVAPPDWATTYGNIYTSACQMCLQQTSFLLGERKCPFEVLYVFERGHKWQAQADAVLNSLALDDLTRTRCRYRNHMFEDKRNECGLQAADLFAWTITKAEICGGKVPLAMRPFVPLVLRLAKSNDRQRINLFTGNKLKRFINEQLYGTPTFYADAGPRRRTLR